MNKSHTYNSKEYLRLFHKDLYSFISNPEIFRIVKVFTIKIYIYHRI